MSEVIILEKVVHDVENPQELRIRVDASLILQGHRKRRSIRLHRGTYRVEVSRKGGVSWAIITIRDVQDDEDLLKRVGESMVAAFDVPGNYFVRILHLDRLPQCSSPASED
ncbi:MAG: hypothetical protein ACR2QC_12005 [Gammaproteobacteria bacterium]